jgi:hypothetical protein
MSPYTKSFTRQLCINNKSTPCVDPSRNCEEYSGQSIPDSLYVDLNGKCVRIEKSQLRATLCFNDGCETTWARDEDSSLRTCFKDIPDLPNRWGWSNGPYSKKNFWPVTLQLYRSAGQCDITKGTLVGTSTITKSGEDFTVDIDIDSTYSICDDEIQVYIGNTETNMKKNKKTVAPGSFPCKGTPTLTCEWQNFDSNETDTVYILIHLNVSDA